MTRRSVLLVVGSVAASLLLLEVSLRLLTPVGFPIDGPQPWDPLSDLEDPADSHLVSKYLEQIPIDPATKRQWFYTDPPPLINRRPVPEEMTRRYKEFAERGLYPPQAQYLWNRQFVLTNICVGPQGFFHNYPKTVSVFEPPSGTVHPRFRFPPNSTLPSGLVTNQFGLRGPPIDRAKPPNTIRIGFAGASTTVTQHHYPYSYPEHVVHWLNMYALESETSVRFEVLNAGREGLNSNDIAAIVRDELLPLEPDIVVYYEGSNQFPSAKQMVVPSAALRAPDDLPDYHVLPTWVRQHVVLGRLIDRALIKAAGEVQEPEKPTYRLVWPDGVDVQAPDVTNPQLPLQLPVILRDLDSIVESLESIGAKLALCSFFWLAEESMRLDPFRHAHIFGQLNTTLWPLQYADIRKLADFQNRVLRRYTESRGIAFLDVAPQVPKDYDLFIDAIHMTRLGVRLRAWITFQQLLPVIQQEILSGSLPRKVPASALPTTPSSHVENMQIDCGPDPKDDYLRLTNAIQLDSIALAYDKASITPGPPVKVTTADQQGAFAAWIPIVIDPAIKGNCFLHVRAQVLSGQIGFGVLNAKTQSFAIETIVDPSAEMSDVYIPVRSPHLADHLIVRNASTGVISEVLIDDVALMTKAEKLTEEITLDQSSTLSKEATIDRGEEIIIHTPPQQWAYAATLPLPVLPQTQAVLVARIQARVKQGKIGFGILAQDQSLVAEQFVGPAGESIEVTLPIPAPLTAGSILVRNAADGGVKSAVVLEEVSIWKLDESGKRE